MCKTLNELTTVVAEYRSLKTLKEELEVQLKDLERQMIGYLNNNDKSSEIGSDFTVKVSKCERRTLDAEKVAKALGDITPFQKVSQYTRLTVH